MNLRPPAPTLIGMPSTSPPVSPASTSKARIMTLEACPTYVMRCGAVPQGVKP